MGPISNDKMLHFWCLYLKYRTSRNSSKDLIFGVIREAIQPI